MKDEAMYRAVAQADGSRRLGLPLQLLERLKPGLVRRRNVSEEEALAAIERLGFHRLHVDVVEQATALAGKSTYRRGALMSRAPAVVDCAGFVKWVFGLAGLCLPRRSIQQSRLGLPGSEGIQPGDLAFAKSRYQFNRCLRDDYQPVGHVGIMVSDHEVVHASYESGGVNIVSLADFMEPGEAGIRRVLPARLQTLVIPGDWETETADDLICAIDDDLATDRRRRQD